jgi:hypothetical protein
MNDEKMKRVPNNDGLAGKVQIPTRTYGVDVQYCDFQYLLGAVLDVVNMAVPNKQQHASAVRNVRRKFDELYITKLRQRDPNAEFALDPGGYVVEPLN